MPTKMPFSAAWVAVDRQHFCSLVLGHRLIGNNWALSLGMLQYVANFWGCQRVRLHHKAETF